MGLASLFFKHPPLTGGILARVLHEQSASPAAQGRGVRDARRSEAGQKTPRNCSLCCVDSFGLSGTSVTGSPSRTRQAMPLFDHPRNRDPPTKVSPGCVPRTDRLDFPRVRHGRGMRVLSPRCGGHRSLGQCRQSCGTGECHGSQAGIRQRVNEY